MTVTLNPTPEQAQIRDAARTMLQAHYPIDRTDVLTGDPMAPLAEFGAFALTLSAEAGGAGFSLIDEALLHVELGRHLVAPCALAGAVAAQLLNGSDHAARRADIISGSLAVAAAVQTRDHLLVLAKEPPSLAAVSGDDGLALVDISQCPAKAAPGLGGAATILQIDPAASKTVLAQGDDRIASRWQVLASAQLLGVAEMVMDLTIDYVQTREQFGRPIGLFQAIKHRCADMAIGCHRLSALLDLAAISVCENHDEADFNVAALATLAPRTALENARAAIQLHGGVGFSAEAAPHLYLKQAHVLASLLPPVDMTAPISPLSPVEEGQK